jgi:indolepyruvate ferredoxin oxidoreductase alpha subunit
MSSIILQKTGTRDLLMGNEAIARGAVEAGVQLVSAYPGTPSSEIGEVLMDASQQSDFYVEWSTNEKVAIEVAAGASLVGGRTMTAMKNAGLNVAMDTFMTIPYGGIKGGMVVVVADDPDAHYSSNEQDTRFAAAYAEIPCLEPEDQQEAKDMARAAFDLSEELCLPVFLRSVSRISHASGNVLFGDITENRNLLGFNKHFNLPYRWNVYGPPGAISKHKWLHGALNKARPLANASPFNKMQKPAGARIGIIATGLGAAYAKEALVRLGVRDEAAFLKLGFIFPLPEKLIEDFVSGLDELILVEEGDPVVENMVRSCLLEIRPALKISGKTYHAIFNSYGELNSDIVTNTLAPFFGEKAKAVEKSELRAELQKLIIPRSSTLCAGCSHIGSYSALREALARYPEDSVHIINGDIGCYEQGGYGVFSAGDPSGNEDSKGYKPESPYDMLDTLYVMGSGISMAHGQSRIGYNKGKLVAVCGDSTFFHAILPAVVNAVYNDSDITFLILDNRWTCMTGHQPNPGTGMNSRGEECPRMDIHAIVEAMGIKSLSVVNAYERENAVEAVSSALEFKGPSVVILEGECQLQRQRRVKKTIAKTYVNTEACDGCKSCVRLGCPAVQFDTKLKKSSIDSVLCVDCGLCTQVCPNGVIKMRRR